MSPDRRVNARQERPRHRKPLFVLYMSYNTQPRSSLVLRQIDTRLCTMRWVPGFVHLFPLSRDAIVLSFMCLAHHQGTSNVPEVSTLQ